MFFQNVLLNRYQYDCLLKIVSLENIFVGARGIVRELRGFAALAEGPRLFPTEMMAHNVL